MKMEPNAGRDEEELPIYAHEYVLGADIGDHTTTPRNGTDVRAYGSDVERCGRCRAYIAAWARRVLFEGVP